MQTTTIRRIDELELSGAEQIPAVASRVLSEHLLQKENEVVKRIEVLETQRRPFSEIRFLSVHTSNGPRRMVLKRIIHHPVNKEITEGKNQAVVEYDILKMLYPKFEQVERCSVPKPRIVIPDIETYIMDFVDGNLLTQDFVGARWLYSLSGFKKLRNKLYDCGVWLRYFQKFTGFKMGGLESLEDVRGRAESRIKLIAESRDSRIPRNFALKAREMLENELRQLYGKEVLLAGRHGDFTPWNILTGRSGITVMDFLGYQSDPIAVDLLKMLVYLEDEGKSMTASGGRIGLLKRAFLEGYGEIPEVRQPVLTICEGMQRIVSIWSNLSAGSQRFHHRIEANKCIKNHLHWLMNENSRKPLLSVETEPS